MIPDITVIMTVGGEQRRLDFRAVPLKVWLELRDSAGLTPKSILTAAGELDVAALAGLIWLEQRARSRKTVPLHAALEALDPATEFDVVDVLVEGKSTLEPDAPVEVQTDPTSAGAA